MVPVNSVFDINDKGDGVSCERFIWLARFVVLIGHCSNSVNHKVSLVSSVTRKLLEGPSSQIFPLFDDRYLGKDLN